MKRTTSVHKVNTIADKDRIKLLEERIELTQDYYLMYIWDQYCSKIQFNTGKQIQDKDIGRTWSYFKPKFLLYRKELIKNRINKIDSLMNNKINKLKEL